MPTKTETIHALLHHMTHLVYDQVYELFKPGMSLQQIENEYRQTLTDVMARYMESDRPVTAFRNEMRRAANDAMTLAGYAGWADGGGSGDLPNEVLNWIISRVYSETAYIEEVFWKLKELRKSGAPQEQQDFIAARVEGYVASLVGVYNYAFMHASSTTMGIWKLGRTEKHCDTCYWLNGQVQPLAWFASNGYIPRQPGSRTLACGGWRCDCGIFDAKTGKQLL